MMFKNESKENDLTSVDFVLIDSVSFNLFLVFFDIFISLENSREKCKLMVCLYETQICAVRHEIGSYGTNWSRMAQIWSHNTKFVFRVNRPQVTYKWQHRKETLHYGGIRTEDLLFLADAMSPKHAAWATLSNLFRLFVWVVLQPCKYGLQSCSED
jgi:hypothetical protein